MLNIGDNMSDIFAVRNLDEKTRETIYKYATEHRINTAEAVKELIFYGMQHIRHTKKEKKYESIFDVYEKLKFSAEPDLSQKIDEIVYDEE